MGGYANGTGTCGSVRFMVRQQFIVFAEILVMFVLCISFESACVGETER